MYFVCNQRPYIGVVNSRILLVVGYATDIWKVALNILGQVIQEGDKDLENHGIL